MKWRDRVGRFAATIRFRDSRSYWKSRYAAGGTSGVGSYSLQARYKAEFLNTFVQENLVASVIEFGCGDGSQLGLADYRQYLGIDIAGQAIRHCIESFQHDETKSFMAYDARAFADPARFIHADLALSLDVVFHLVEDDVYEAYMRALFNAADRFVVIYARDRDESPALKRHVRWREFTPWIEKNIAGWRLSQVEPAPSAEYQDFHVFTRVGVD
jgi:hypothetical protein